MSAAQTTEKMAKAVEVGDLLVLAKSLTGVHAALVTAVNPFLATPEGTMTQIRFLIQPAGEEQVVETGGEVPADYVLEVL